MRTLKTSRPNCRIKASTTARTTRSLQGSIGSTNHYDAFASKIQFVTPITPVAPTFDAAVTGELIQTPWNATGGDPMATGFSEAGVRYFDGAISLSMSDLSSSGFGTPWGQDRQWTNNTSFQLNTV